MLFKNPLGAITPPELIKIRTIRNQEIKNIVFQWEDEDYTPEELKELLEYGQSIPLGIRIHQKHALGKQKDLSPLLALIELSAEVIQHKPSIILTSDTLALGEIFEYLDQHASEFTALQNLKTEWVETIIKQITELQQAASAKGVELLIENAPIGGKEYFEPGHSLIHPALRTHRNLITIAERTGCKIAFNTAHARNATNVLSYLYRSRSLFASATEDEILSATTDWIEFYEEIRAYVGMIFLSDCISWADTEETNYLPFREDTYPELLAFADVVDSHVPIILFTGHKTGRNHELPEMVRILRQLKRI